MTDFASAIDVVMDHEGGIATLQDGAGETRWGITEATCRDLGIGLPETPNQARGIYRKYFWNPWLDSIVLVDYTTKLFDDRVNQGPLTATKNIQEALVKTGTVVQVDGILGKATVTALNLTPENMLMPNWRRVQYASYDRWIMSNPGQRQQYRNGLAKRAAWPDSDGMIAKQLIEGKY